MKKIILSPWTLGISVVLMVYGVYSVIFGMHYFLNSPAYTEGVVFAALGLGVILGRHETYIAVIREDLKIIKEDTKYIKEKIS